MTHTPPTRERGRGHSRSLREATREDLFTIRGLGGKDMTLSSLSKREGPHASPGAVNDNLMPGSITGSTWGLWPPASLTHLQLRLFSTRI